MTKQKFWSLLSAEERAELKYLVDTFGEVHFVEAHDNVRLRDKHGDDEGGGDELD